MTKDLGDFQTPPELVREVIDCLYKTGQRWTGALEPTCGIGGFIKGLTQSPSPPSEIIGLEIQDRHLEQALQIAGSHQSTKIHVSKANIFDLDLKRDLRWQTSGPLLVIGNPPWVTNSALGALGSSNIPRKSNVKKLRGIEALTGSSNFDIAEFIWLKLITELADQNPTIALLCKTSVARNVLQFAYDNSISIKCSWLRRIDAKKHFKAAVDACLFCIDMGSGEPEYETPVFASLDSRHPETVMGFTQGRLIFDIEAYSKVEFVDGNCPIIWRQGVKHDAAQVMELQRDDNRFRNRQGDLVDVEQEYIYPFLKSGDLFQANHEKPDLAVIIPQRRIGEDTNKLENAAPRLWRYLSCHSDIFSRRKSSIYQAKPPFSIFGIGNYSFAEFKVAVSGLHKEPRFRLVTCTDDRPVMLDDTSYFLPCQSAHQAALIAAIMNHSITQQFIRSTMFPDAKRPIIKRLLQRIDLFAVLQHVDRDSILKAADEELRKLDSNSASSNLWPDDLSVLLKA
jgi:hypothetical protein